MAVYPPIDRKYFYDSVRKSLFHGKLDSDQVASIDNILDIFEMKYPELGLNALAYCLGTVYHECSYKKDDVFYRSMQPVEEIGKGRRHDYGKKLKYGNGTRKRIAYAFPDKFYYGRGYVQLTWFELYDKLGKILKVDLLNNPEMALGKELAAEIMFTGMKDGLFTGKRLSFFFTEKRSDWVKARSIINGNDKAEEIAEYAKLFHKALLKPSKVKNDEV